MPTVDPRSSAQNAWVQDWLTAWANANIPAPGTDDFAAGDWATYESIIELVQETYGA